MRYISKMFCLSALSLIGACKERTFSDNNVSTAVAASPTPSSVAEKLIWNRNFSGEKVAFDECMKSPETNKIRDAFAVCLTASLLKNFSGSLQIFDEKHIQPLLFPGVKQNIDCEVNKGGFVPIFSVTSFGQGSDWSGWMQHLLYKGWYRSDASVVGEYFLYERPESDLSQAQWKRLDSDDFGGHRKLQEKTPDVVYFVKFDPKNVGPLSFGQINLKTKQELWRCDPKKAD